MRKQILIFVFTLFLSAAVFSQTDSSTFVRVMTYNIHHGEGTDSVINISRIAQIILDNNIDIACLQEVDKGVCRTNKIDIPKLLADQTGMNFSFHKNIEFQGGEYGNCILSRFPTLSDTNLHYTMLREGEQRGLLQVVINICGIQIVVMNTHLDYHEDDSERILSVDQIYGATKKYSEMPVLIVGDFNDIPGSRTHLKMKVEFIDVWEHLNNGEGFSYPSEEPTKRIDYIFLKDVRSDSMDMKIIPQKIFIQPSIASDHLPVIAELILSVKNK